MERADQDIQRQNKHRRGQKLLGGRVGPAPPRRRPSRPVDPASPTSRPGPGSTHREAAGPRAGRRACERDEVQGRDGGR